MQQGTTYIPNSKEAISTVTRKGQVTIPIAVRRHLGVDSRDKVAFVIEPDGEVKVTNVRYKDINSLKGAAGVLKKPMAWDEVRSIAREDKIDAKYSK